MTKYDALGNYLAKQFSKELASRISLTFQQVEEILGFPLPRSAYAQEEWWSNSQLYPQAHSWLDIGWEVSKANLEERVVTFRHQLRFVIGKVTGQGQEEPTLEVVLDNRGFTLALAGRHAWASSRYPWRQIVQVLLDMDPHQFGYLTNQPMHHVFPEMLAELGYSVVNWETGGRWQPVNHYKMACFSCDGKVEEGERYIAISRLRRKRGKVEEDEIIEALASLQICRNCAVTAQSGSIPLSNLPIPILKLEEQGFYWFVRHQVGEKEPWQYSVSENNCSICGSQIAMGQDYTLIEITEEEMKRDGTIRQLDRTILATVCDSCSFDLLLDLSLPHI